MTSRQRRIQTLYEISLAIETGGSIEETADQALAAYLQKLNCSVGGIFEISAPSDGAEPTLVTSIPANPERNELFRSAREHLMEIAAGARSGVSGRSDRTAESAAVVSESTTVRRFADSLPATGTVDGSGTYYLFDLPGFGVMVLGKQGGSLDLETASALDPLNNRLAQACRSNRRERALRRQRDRFEAIFAATAEPTVEVVVTEDGTERIHRANDAFRSTFGFLNDSLRGQSLNELITPEDQPVETGSLIETLETGEPFRQEVQRETSDGVGYFLFTAVPVTATERTEYFGVFVDITDQRERELSLQELYVAAQDILTEGSRHRICQTVVQTVESVLGHSSVGVHLYDRDSGALEPVVTSAAVRERLSEESITYTDRDSVVWEAYEREELIRIDDIATFDGRLPNDETPVGSALIVPVGSHGVVVTSAPERNSFDDGDVYFLQVLSQLTAIGLDRQLCEEGLRTTQETARRALRERSHEEMVESVLTDIPEALNMPLMGIWKHRPARQRLEPVAATDHSERLLGDSPSFLNGDSLAWQSFESDTTLVAADVATDSDAYNSETPLEEEVIVPIGDFGVLIAGSAYTESFSELDADILDSLGTNLEAITEVIDSRRDIDLLNQVIARILRHNVRNKLTAIMGYTSQIEAKAEEPIRGYAKRVLENCRDLKKTSKHAKEMRKIVNSRDEITTVALEQEVRSAASTVDGEFPNGELEVDVRDAATVTAHPELETALAHLIRNGFEHNDSDAPAVEVAVRRGDEDVRIEIRDNGPGIDPYELDVIEQHGESALEHGSGAGLWIVDRVVRYSEAALEIDTEDGTTATIAFPDH